MKLQTTTDYKLFQLLCFNRDVKKTAKLQESMKAHGFIPAYPIHVVREKGKLKIKGGHHRFTVASGLGLPIHYVVCDDKSTIHELEAATVKWELDDYLTSFSRSGDQDYITVLEYHKRTGIGIRQSLSMLGGECALGNNKRDVFKKGGYKIINTIHAEIVADVVAALKNAGIKWACNSLCVGSISRLVMAGHTDISRLKEKIKTNPSLIQKKATLAQFTDMWEEIYNRKARGNRIPIAFLTNETMNERAKTFGKNGKP